MDGSTPGFPILHHLLEFAQIHVLGINDTVQPSRPLSPPSQLYGSKNQLQEKKNCKTHKHMEAKQYGTEQPMDHWTKQKKKLDTNENENLMIQNLKDRANAALRGKFIML